MKNTLELPASNRQRRDEIYVQMDAVKSAIQREVEARYNSEYSAVKQELASLHLEDREFREKASRLLYTLDRDKRYRIVTQVGVGCSVLKEYIGQIATVSSGTFNFKSPDYNEGKEFTVGYSCLQLIEEAE